MSTFQPFHWQQKESANIRKIIRIYIGVQPFSPRADKWTTYLNFQQAGVARCKISIITFLWNLENYRPDNKKITDICKQMLKTNNKYKMDQ